MVRRFLLLFLVVSLVLPTSAVAVTPPAPSYLEAQWILRLEQWMNSGQMPVSVGDLAAKTGMSPNQALQATAKARSAIKGTGVNLSKGQLAAGASALVVGLAVQYGGDAVLNWVGLGSTVAFGADGQQLSESEAWVRTMSGQPVYRYCPGGSLFPDSWDEELDFIFAGWEVPGEVVGYTFPSQVQFAQTYRVLSPTSELTYSSNALVPLPTKTLPTVNHSPLDSWNESQFTLSTYAQQWYGRSDWPILPIWIVSANSYRLAGFVNRVNGATYKDLLIDFIHSGQSSISYIRSTDGATSKARGDACLAWVLQQMAYNEPYAVPITIPNVTPALHTGVLLPNGGNLPSMYKQHGAIDGSTSVQDALDTITVPNVLPPAVREAVPWLDPNDAEDDEDTMLPGVYLPEGEDVPTIVPSFITGFWTNLSTFVQNLVRTSPDTMVEQVNPLLARVRGESAHRWPFAGATVVHALEEEVQRGGSNDPMEWFLDVTPNGDEDATVIPDVPTVGVWIRPLHWLDPFKDYRWVFVGAIWLGALWSIAQLLKPRVNV